MYQKEIIYLSLYDNQIKTGSAGFLKVERRQEAYKLELQIKNAAGINSGALSIRLQNETGWQEVGPLTLKDGGGSWKGSAREAVSRVEIILSELRRIKGESRSIKAPEVKRALTTQTETASAVRTAEAAESGTETTSTAGRTSGTESASITGRVSGTESASITGRTSATGAEPPAEIASVPGGSSEMQSINSREKILIKEAAPIMEAELPVIKERRLETIPLPERRKRETSMETPPRETVLSGPEPSLISQERAPQPNLINIRSKRVVKVDHTPLYEDKWEQLQSTYETIHPYGDNRVYVKLAPKDFVVLRENYQHLVNNSFLLHGFYNYRYLILGKEKNFYLGVPGVFYEREKMVALMFGFEAFECEGGNADEGKFGYYLRKVEI